MKKKEPSLVSQNIETLRLNHQLNQDEFSELLGISYDAYLNYKRGTVKYPDNLIDKVVELFSVSNADLFSTHIKRVEQPKVSKPKTKKRNYKKNRKRRRNKESISQVELDAITLMVKQGKPDAEIARWLDISKASFSSWKRTYKPVMEAYEKGLLPQYAPVENKNRVEEKKETTKEKPKDKPEIKESQKQEVSKLGTSLESYLSTLDLSRPDNKSVFYHVRYENVQLRKENERLKKEIAELKDHIVYLSIHKMDSKQERKN